ncbi:MAG: D-glycero-beta-D-manno-heptose 1-phosphate adenylyltransferase [Chitinophagaceae bacterium]|jgi:D-beta-D-heptose 7-phosphate kinase/D-beta-D-heptose 1-phosphate adenosyltransferase|nr:D-glycero-beta-D-manno-heptose 1-phosphate adenylyltransferase [Chitinophagaceae bacterium]
MRNTSAIPDRIMELSQLVNTVNAWRVKGRTIAFTNGVFDIIHAGHIFSLSQAAAEADYLVVGINSDASVKRLKGPERPIKNEAGRALLMASLVMVDAVIIFEEDTPLNIITAILPDVLVKGGDYTEDQVVGAKEVIANGGRVVINPLIEGISTTNIIQTIRQWDNRMTGD